MKHAHTYDRNMGTRRRQHTRRQRRNRQRQRQRRSTSRLVVDVAASFAATASRQRRRRRATAGDDWCDLASTAAVPRSSRQRRRTARRSWSAPDHGVGSPVDRRQLTTSCRSGHAHQCSGQQLTQSPRLNRRPFTFTTDV